MNWKYSLFKAAEIEPNRYGSWAEGKEAHERETTKLSSRNIILSQFTIR